MKIDRKTAHAGGGSATPDQMRRLVYDLAGRAMSCVARAKAGEITRRLMSPKVAERLLSQPGMLDLAELLTSDLALFAPSASGSTAVERFARQHRPKDATEAEALRLLRGARFLWFTVVDKIADGVFAATDMTDRTFELHSDTLAGSAVGSYALAARMCWLDERRAFPISPVIALADSALAVATSFLRDGKGVSNSQRCAEAVYYEVLRCGERVIGPEPPPVNPLPCGPEDGFPHDIAAIWAASDVPPGDDDVQDIRDGTGLGALTEALACCVIASDHGLRREAAAYERIVILQLETIQRRAACGITQGLASLDAVAAEVAAAVARRLLPPGVVNLLADLARKVRLGAAAGRPVDADLDKVLTRIQALRAKTVEQGCTEEEAILAARKVAELLDRYGLSLSEVDIKNQACEGVGIDTSRRRTAPIDECVPAMAMFCDCRVWGETAADGRLRYIFFGMPADVAAARYVYELIDRTFEDETARFKASSLYADHPTGTRRSASNSFQVGLAHGIVAKLNAVRAERTTAMQSSGRDLVPVKHAAVEDELAALGLSFRRKAGGRGRTILRDAYHAGKEAGDRFEVTPGIEAK